MNGNLAQRVHAAAVAGWWSILIMAGCVTVSWLAWLAILAARPSWLITLWGGGDLTWETVHMFVLYFIAAWKGIVLVAVMVVIWLTIWARKLAKLAA